MIEVRNTLFQPLTFHLAKGPTGDAGRACIWVRVNDAVSVRISSRPRLRRRPGAA